MRSKFSTLIPLVVALCAAVGCDKKDNTIKIGQAVALTGDNSTWGHGDRQDQRQGRGHGQADPAHLL